MQLRKLCFLSLCANLCILACKSKNPQNEGSDSTMEKPTIINPADNIPELRTEQRKDPVDQYREKTDNPLNDWYFSVQLYETAKTFNYLIKLEFEEIHAEDTLRLPNLGTMPKPILKKGTEKYSCIIGFLDQQNKFREYKLVHVDNGNNLKITALKHYTVATYQ